ncbi:MAG: phosphatase PAP2 family protein [Acidimicrobiales bacterium]
MRGLDVRLYRDVNGWAMKTSYLHGLGRAAAGWLAFALLAGCLALAWYRGRRRSDAPVAVASVLWALAAAVVAVVVARSVAAAVGRAHPYQVVAHAEVLVSRVHGSGFPAAAAAGAGALAAALWFSDAAVGGAAGAIAVLLAGAGVYVGVLFPGDVAAGLVLGAVVAVALRPFGLRLLSWLTVKVERSPLHLVVAAHRV